MASQDPLAVIAPVLLVIGMTVFCFIILVALLYWLPPEDETKNKCLKEHGAYACQLVQIIYPYLIVTKGSDPTLLRVKVPETFKDWHKLYKGRCLFLNAEIWVDQEKKELVRFTSVERDLHELNTW